MTTDTRLFDLLPQIYRVRDSEVPGGGSLEAMLAVVDQQVEVIRTDISGLLDNFFIDTCDDWVVPYIGDLVGTNLVSPITLRARTDVARTIYYRRRKGTVPMLEELARDVTGWSAKVVEFFQILGWTQNENHVRLDHGGWFDLRDDAIDNAVGSAFDQAAHTVDVRLPAPLEGWHNIHNIGCFLWRLQSYPLVAVQPRPVAGHPNHFHFNTLGQPEPIFIEPNQAAVLAHATDEDDVRGPINRRRLEPSVLAIDHFDAPDASGQVAVHLIPSDRLLAQGWQPGLWLELIDPADATQTVSAVLAATGTSGDPLFIHPLTGLTTQTRLRAFPRLPLYYGNPRGFSVRAGGGLIAPLATAPVQRRILIGDLCDWREPDPGTLVIDVRLGRFAFAPGEVPAGAITVDFNYGFSGDIGAGPYPRAETDSPSIVVQQAGTISNAKTTIEAALDAWLASPADRTVIEIADSATYAETLPPIALPASAFQLTIRAASGQRPTILLGADIQLTGNAPEGTVSLQGLLISGGMLDLQGTLSVLTVQNCTLDPGGGLSSDGVTLRPMRQSLQVAAANTTLNVRILSSITGALRLPDTIEALRIDNSIVDAQGDVAICGPAGGADSGPRSTIRATTIFGRFLLRELTLGSEVLFVDPVLAVRRQRGCVRFCYLAPASQTPRAYHCLPPDGTAPVDLPRFIPTFTSTRYGDPGYAQLSRACPRALLTGGSDGAEIGAFFGLKNALREENLLLRLEEYLPFGLAAALIEVT